MIQVKVDATKKVGEIMQMRRVYVLVRAIKKVIKLIVLMCMYHKK